MPACIALNPSCSLLRSIGAIVGGLLARHRVEDLLIVGNHSEAGVIQVVEDLDVSGAIAASPAIRRRLTRVITACGWRALIAQDGRVDWTRTDSAGV